MSPRGSVWRTTAFGIVGAVAVLFIGFGLIVVNILGVFRGSGPQEDDPEVVAAREAAAQKLFLVGPAVNGGAQVGRAEQHTQCRQGEHNWKIQDDFDLACELIQTESVAVADKEAFRADMLAFDETLRTFGWVDEGAFGMRRVIAEYWDQLVTPERPAYSMDDLPGATYAKGDLKLGVRWVESDSPDELAAKAPAGGYAVILTQSTEYFRE